MTTELGPCPHCGSKPRWCGEGNNDPADDHNCHQIHCDGCGVQFDVDTFEAKDAPTIEDTKLAVAKIWNTRASDQQNEVIVAELDSLAMYLWKTHYKAVSPDFELLNNPLGVLSQIDNMVTGLVREQSLDSLKARIEEETIERCIKAAETLLKPIDSSEALPDHAGMLENLMVNVAIDVITDMPRKYQPSNDTKAVKGEIK